MGQSETSATAILTKLAVFIQKTETTKTLEIHICYISEAKLLSQTTKNKISPTLNT